MQNLIDICFVTVPPPGRKHKVNRLIDYFGYEITSKSLYEWLKHKSWYTATSWTTQMERWTLQNCYY